MKLCNDPRDCEIGDGVLHSRTPGFDWSKPAYKVAARLVEDFKARHGQAFESTREIAVFVFEKAEWQEGDGPLLRAWRRVS